MEDRSLRVLFETAMKVKLWSTYESSGFRWAWQVIQEGKEDKPPHEEETNTVIRREQFKTKPNLWLLVIFSQREEITHIK